VSAKTKGDLLDRVFAATGLATDDEREEFTTLLLDVHEILDKFGDRMFTLIEDASPASPVAVSFEDIGKQLTFARWVWQMGQHVTDKAANMEKAIFADLDDVREYGWSESVPQFSRYGSPNYTDGSLNEGYSGRAMAAVKAEDA
jgi:hypothetical protein